MLSTMRASFWVIAPLIARMAAPLPGQAPLPRARFERALGTIADIPGTKVTPTLALGDTLFWGDDAHDFALAALRDPHLLDEAGMRRLATLPEAARRR